MASWQLMTSPSKGHGFTLIEVIIALFVIALGMGALLSTLVSAADNAGHLRNKSFAEWVALNRISEARLALIRPTTGVTTGEAEFAGAKWQWRQTVTEIQIKGIKQLAVAVARADGNNASTPSTSENATFPALATAYGFISDSVPVPNGSDPDWSLQLAAGPPS
jgi:general secretion pathway protein I